MSKLTKDEIRIKELEETLSLVRNRIKAWYDCRIFMASTGFSLTRDIAQEQSYKNVIEITDAILNKKDES